MSTEFHLMEDRKITGPHSLAVLRQKADVFAITPETPVLTRGSADTTWRLISQIPALNAELFPQKKSLALQKNSPALSSLESAYEPVQVEKLLRQNTERQVAAESLASYTPAPGPQRRRNRNFLIYVLLLNLPGLFALVSISADSPLKIILPSLSVLATAIVYWVMFHVLDAR